MSGTTATPSLWWPGNSSEQHYNYSSTDNGTALSDRNVNATGNATTMSLSMMPPPQHSFDESIISIIVLFASILSVSMCCLLICRVSMWSEQRRRNAMVAEQHESNSLGVALSVLEGLETGSYKEIVVNKAPRRVMEAELNGLDDHGTCEQRQQPAGAPAHKNAVDGDVQHQEQKHKEQLEGQDGEEEETCTVCLCEFADDAPVRLLPCGHFFHTECVDCWLQKNATCPTCRWSLLTEDQMSAAAAAAASSGGAEARAWAHQRHSPQQMQSISIEAAARPSTRPRAQEAPSHSRSLVQALGDILTAILISEHGTLA